MHFTCIFATKISTSKIQSTKIIGTLQNYPHLKNLNLADSRTRLGEIHVTLDSDYLWKFVSGKVKFGTGHEPRGIDKVFGYILPDPFANVEGIKMNHRNQSSITTTHISLTLQRSHCDYFDDVMKKGCHFDEPSNGMHYDSSNETSHYDGSSEGNHLGRDFGVDHLGGSYTEVIKVEEPTPVKNYLRDIQMNDNTNRYETGLPFKSDFVLLPDNYDELCRKHLPQNQQ